MLVSAYGLKHPTSQSLRRGWPSSVTYHNKRRHGFSDGGLRYSVRPLRGHWSLDIWKIEVVLRRSKIFIVIAIQIAIRSVGAAYYGQHLHTDLHPYCFRRSGTAESDSVRAQR